MKKTDDEYLDSEEFRELLAQYEQAVNSGQPVFMDAEELAEIADYYQMSGDKDSADKAITLALNLSPGAVAPLVYKVHEALYNGDVPAAKAFLEKIIERDDPDYVYTTGEIMLAEGKADEADAYFREQLRLVVPDEHQDYVVDVASIFSDYGYNELALSWMMRGKQEETPDFKELMGRTLFGLGKYKDSERLFNELIDIDPFSKRYWNALASAQYMNEDYSNAIQSSEFAIAIDPDDPESIINKANGLWRLHNEEEALTYYNRYLEQEPDDEYALLQKAVCLINLDRYDEAIPVLHEALRSALAVKEETGEDSPCIVEIYQELAFALSDAGDTEGALHYLSQTDHYDCDHAQMQLIKGHVLLSAERATEAEACFREAISNSTDPQVTFLRVIVSLFDNKYVDVAYNMFRHFFAHVDADFDQGYSYMALCCYELKRYDEFLDYLKQACQRNPEECSLVLGHLFPDTVKPEDYYQYIKDKLK